MTSIATCGLPTCTNWKGNWRPPDSSVPVPSSPPLGKSASARRRTRPMSIVQRSPSMRGRISPAAVRTEKLSSSVQPCGAGTSRPGARRSRTARPRSRPGCRCPPPPRSRPRRSPGSAERRPSRSRCAARRSRARGRESARTAAHVPRRSHSRCPAPATSRSARAWTLCTPPQVTPSSQVSRPGSPPHAAISRRGR